MAFHASRSAGRRWAARAVLALAVAVGLVGILAVWGNRQVLDAGNWSSTSTALLKNQAIRKQLAVYVVDQVYENVDVERELRDNAPDALRPFAGAASDGLHGAAEQGVNALLGRSAVQDVWRTANRVAMQQLVNVVDDNDNAVISSSPGRIAVNIRPIVQAAADDLGLPNNIARTIPESAGRFAALQPKDVSAIQTYGGALRGLALFLPIISALLFALALWLARGRRRRTLLLVGCSVIAMGLLVLAARLLLTNQGASALAANENVRPAVQAALSISTRMLQGIGWTTALAGVPLVLAALAGGPASAAVAVRGRAEPLLVAHRTVLLRTLGGLSALLIMWILVAGTAKLFPLLIVFALQAHGLMRLRPTHADAAGPALSTTVLHPIDDHR